jgi:hypothetical protein
LDCDGRAVPPVKSYCIGCPGKELLSCVLQAIPAAAGILLIVHETRQSPKEGRGQLSVYSITELEFLNIQWGLGTE